jgi:hypothetical protein
LPYSQPVTGELENTMSLFRHKKYGFIFKGVLFVLYFVLFGSPLSHKFYLCANFSSRLFKACHCKVAHTEPSVHNGPLLLGHKNISSLSLDKRYELKSTFALVSPEVGLNPVFIDHTGAYNSFCQVFVFSNSVVHPLRGPPSV